MEEKTTGFSNNQDESRVTFINGNSKKFDQNEGCCYKRSTHICCILTLFLGCLSLILGVIILICGESLLTAFVANSLAFSPGSDSLTAWLDPPVQPYLSGYVFSVNNPEEVMQGAKPVLDEIGPFTYKAVTIKDSVDYDTKKVNLEFNDDGGETLTYRQRYFYFLDPSQSIGDPEKTFVTVPNIPFLTGLRKIRDMGFGKGIASNILLNKGRGSPFINVSVSGLLWGYHDDLPCATLTRPDSCGVDEDEVDLFDEDNEEAEEEDWDWKRKKRSVAEQEEGEKDLRLLDHNSFSKSRMGFVDCECEWGLFRDRNVSLRKSVTVNTGRMELKRKGWVEQYNGDNQLHWWRPGTSCDRVGGQDGGTLYPGARMEDDLQIFVSLMCRRIGLKFEKNVEHEGINTFRFVPPPNALGSHDDDDGVRRNEDNKCYCMKDQGFDCYQSGVFNMAPCKATPDLPTGAPIALSYPHFYQAHPRYQEAVVGLKPDKEKHQFYVDIVPELGVPLAIRPRLQLNVVINQDSDIPVMSNLSEELILPFLWVQDGFSEPGDEMAAQVRFVLTAPSTLSLLGGVALVLVGGALVLTALVWKMTVNKQSVGGRF